MYYWYSYRNVFSLQVKNWITINEPWTILILGYENGNYAPGIVLFGSINIKTKIHLIPY